MTRLTEHFALEELVHSDTAVRLGIDNKPPGEVIPHLGSLARGLEQIRLQLAAPLHINSAFRCEALERVLCAKDFAAWCQRNYRPQASSWPEYFARKAHPRGFAADFTAPQFGTPAQVVAALRGAGLAFDQLIEEGTWVHVSFDPRLRGEVLTARFGADGTPSYSQGAG